MTYFCQFCAFCCPTWRQLLRHTFESHSASPNFSYTCGIDGCPQTFHKYSTILSHLSRKHPTVQSYPQPMVVNNEIEVEGADASSVDEMLQVATLPTATGRTVQRPAAMFLLTLKEQYRLTQKAVDFVSSQVKEMVNYAVEDLGLAVDAHIHELGVLSEEQRVELGSIFQSPNPFTGLESEYLQNKYYRECFNLVVRLIIICVCEVS